MMSTAPRVDPYSVRRRERASLLVCCALILAASMTFWIGAALLFRAILQAITP